MVNEISSVGMLPAQGLGRTVDVQSKTSTSGADVQAVTPQKLNSGPQFTGFSKLAGAKDEATQVAQSVRDVSNALDRVGQVLKNLKQEVQMVKNYPPYPPGNEQRVAYIKGISGLRKELDALTVPAVKDSNQPVFYPRASDLPVLAPKTASNQDVKAFGQAVDAVQARLNASYAELQSQVNSLPKINGDLQVPVLGTNEASRIGTATAAKLAQSAQPMLGQSGAVALLG